jgi:poly(3-hydroxybutyrate) depolymerase
MRAFFLASAVILTACTAGAMAPVPPSDAMDVVYPGARRYEFSNWSGAPLRVWIFRSSRAGADAPVVFVMHGVQRDADRYLREWAPVAEAHGAVLVVPEFDAAAFPGAAGYNLGNTFDQSGAPVERRLWSYSAIEAIFDDVVLRERLNARRYYLFGHSAGGQFVHRFAMLGAGPRLERAVAANSGWYTLPSPEIAWPYGLEAGPPTPEARALFGAPLHLVLGEQDIDPNHRSLSREPGAMAQGEHRFARGQHFYAVARAQAAEEGVPLRWSCSTAPGLAHDNALAARYAADVLFGPEPAPSETCRQLPSLVDR